MLLRDALRALSGIAGSARMTLTSFISVRSQANPAFHRPCSLSGLGLPVFCCLPVPERACGTLGRFTAPAAPCAKGVDKNAHELLSDADQRLRSARDGFFGLLNAPRRRRCRRLRPVRASCCPGTHLDRSPVLPASVPSTYLGALPLAIEGPASWRPSHPAPRSKDGSNAPSHRSGTGERISPEIRFRKERNIEEPVQSLLKA